MRRNATKSWKLAAILNFGGHFEILYLTVLHSDQNCFLNHLVLKTKLLHRVEMKTKYTYTRPPPTLVSLICCKVVHITVMPPGDFSMLKNLCRKSHAWKAIAKLTEKQLSEFHLQRNVSSKFTRTELLVMLNICAYFEVYRPLRFLKYVATNCRFRDPVARQPAFSWKPFCAPSVGRGVVCMIPPSMKDRPVLSYCNF